MVNPRTLHRGRTILLSGLVLYLVLSAYILLSHTPNSSRSGASCAGLPSSLCPLENNQEGLKPPILKPKHPKAPNTNDFRNHLKTNNHHNSHQIQRDNNNEFQQDHNEQIQQDSIALPKEKLQKTLTQKRRSYQDLGSESDLRQNVSKTRFKEEGRREISSSSVSKDSPRLLRPFPLLYKPVLKEGVNCSRVWEGDGGEVEKALGFQDSILPARRPAGFYQNITSDCRRYRQQAGYIESVSEEEREFPLAFSVMVYKEMEQVERLLRAVYRPHNAYCLHLDFKASPQLVQDLESLSRCLPNVVWSPRRLDVQWGQFSVLHMELLCMEALWDLAVGWRYVINLTGQEFPVKTNKELVKILMAYRGANDILGEIPKERNKWRWKKAGNPPHNISVAKGPVHIAASRGFVDFVLHSQQARDFLAWTRRTGIPDETFFATVNNMHQFGVPGSYTGNLTKYRIMLNRFKIWDISNRTCSGRFVRHICHFGPREVAVLARSRHLVANKFTYDLHPLAWDCTEQWYFRRVRREEETGRVDVNTEHYRRLVIVQHALRPEHSPWG